MTLIVPSKLEDVLSTKFLIDKGTEGWAAKWTTTSISETLSKSKNSIFSL